MYQLLRRFLFLFDPERVHYFSMYSLQFLCRFGFARKWLIKRFYFSNPSLERNYWGLHFKNPVGLAAGFDKNAKYLRELECLGFGFVEIGTVTPLPQAGNEKPRLFRLPEDKAIINRMGFNNDGVKMVAKRLKEWKEMKGNNKLQTTNYKLIIGGNIGKNKITPNEDAWKDYESCFTELFDYVDYFVVNVSSPNTPGLRELQEKDSLKKILTHLQSINNQKQNPKPILLKIAPDLTQPQIDDVIQLALEIKLDGLVATNTTITREGLSQQSEVRSQKIGAGGLSGKPVKERSTAIVQYISQKTNGQIPIMASGGIFTGDDAREKVKAGASLVQVWTGFIYEGPMIAKNICQYLAR
ncbi:MAG: quinone-dependent dihydroorotate dehydrogenase [Sphingobacteriales bacterium]|nr:quinone-dependent dihydroorotate dehydrogenase [Sphingobacteriales bacterium]MBI3716971.1 quinone-dependent dihydroorotate dehydrogenase [Sphingobacteriales bacterium]